jgi:hypothetical protein
MGRKAGSSVSKKTNYVVVGAHPRLQIAAARCGRKALVPVRECQRGFIVQQDRDCRSD